MSKLQQDYLEKIYAGFLGMNIGIRLGAPVEPTVWTYERIRDTYGDIRNYIKDYKNFAADDDVNGPVFFLRALDDDAINRELQPTDVARAWLNYAREGVGMFWWGGYGTSTEHTAYLNLKNGIPAPQSGSIGQNGAIISEQIGGQIFIDTWGLVWPDNIEKASEYAGKAASVSHDGNGLYGAKFIAACISKAFSEKNSEKIILAGLTVIPQDSTYASVINAVLEFYRKHPEDFRKCRDYLTAEWGYDKYKGVCHIIPNAGVCVLSLLYGKGDFARTIEIATMCGWDTDCNAGNVGTIMGVASGIEGIPSHYRKPINDFIAISGISGYLNILDIPSYCMELALHGYRLSGEEPPNDLKDKCVPGEIYFDFELPGSTHGFRLSDNINFMLRHSDKMSYNGKGSLEVIFDRVQREYSTRIFYKPFYRRSDFNDERYSPTFAPKVYPGQKVSMKVYMDQWNGEGIHLATYVRNTWNGDIIQSGYCALENGKWNDVEFTVPDTEGAMIDEVGIILESFSSFKNKDLGRIFIDEFRVSGKAKYQIDFSRQTVEFGCITPFSHNHGAWSIENGRMHVITAESCEAYTGNYFTKDVHIKAIVNPQSGYSHNLAFRAQGAQRGYHVGFDGKGCAALSMNNFGINRLVTVPYNWEHGKDYLFEVKAYGDTFSFSIDNEVVLEYKDTTFKYGMVGFSRFDIGRAFFGNLDVEEL